jgi:NAD kinase
VPLCPHALTNRPILVGDRNEIEIRIVHATDSRAHFDGQVTADLKNGDTVRIRRSEYSICLAAPTGLQLLRDAAPEAALERAAEGTLGAAGRPTEMPCSVV